MMGWHKGSIPEAISEAKSKQALFLVFVSGNDEQSQKMRDALQDPSVATKLNDSCVALDLEANSESTKQFSQIYPIVVIPSTFFIGNNGVPLEVIGGSLNSSQLLEKVNRVIELHQQNIASSGNKSLGTVSSDVNQNAVSSSGLTTSEDNSTKPCTKTCTESGVVQESPSSDNLITNTEDQQSVPSTSQNAESKNVPEQISLEERVERAKHLALQLQEKKRIEEEEKEKQTEIERRKLGREVQKNKLKQQEQEVKQLADEIAKEKAEERAAREKIREQIALDRAERATKFNAMKAEEERLKQEALQTKLKAEQERATVEASNRSLNARLQFRLPNGSSMNHQFDAGDSLQTVIDYVKENVKPPFSPFRLSLAFPRREFDKNDFSQTLRDLQLAPTACILVLPVTSSAVQSSAKFETMQFLWLILSPFIGMWRMLQTFIFGTPSTSFRDQRGNPIGSSQGDSSRTGGTPNVAPQRSSTSADRRAFGRREGNIYRLPDPNGEDDDNNTWNGNSTQQQ